ncbi:MAG: prolipoprotein diacylglyceryl transferase [Clostridia bacterium]|nr:prolipoprotein diacylglyceryl transferase [Clostridia bacterium]
MTCVPEGIITFPMFGDGFKITAPSTFDVFGMTVHWYGVLIALGFLLGVWYGAKNSEKFGIKFDTIIDLIIWTVPMAIIGGRIYYVIFNYDLYRNNFVDVFKIWHGGIAFYGVMIAAVITIIIFCRHRRIKVGALLDFAAPGFLIGQVVGRWGNFINREAFGVETDIFCRMGLTDASGNTIYVHPTFLYESLWNLVGLILIWLIYFKKGSRKYDGQLFAVYIGWYGMARLIIEGLRTDSLFLFSTGIRISQLVGGLCVIGAAIYLTINRKRNNPEKLFVNQVKEREQNSSEPEVIDNTDSTEEK